ncbi:stage V sporulation protein AD [Paenisporosarcina cavernae]|uniref:stage V sporulation protein AD n=1 Tax=Paenisporosarcina cavernae TaxID=2320858 RepID=UPI001EE53123|nr:stage V sporulation protein AD [Paenisporosarcina cavernae]
MIGGHFIFPSQPKIVSTGTVCGPIEKASPFSVYFDQLSSDELFGEDTNEKAHALLTKQAIETAIRKAGIHQKEIDVVLAGDLINQMTPTSFAMATLESPFMGVFSACATSISSMIIGAALLEGKLASTVVTAASSHHNAVERQFRYPVDYGAQKPPTSQWTVTAGGAAVISRGVSNKPIIVRATVGKVIDSTCTDPLDMGSAMAPAAFDTIVRHLESSDADSYDLVITGDLGKTGYQALLELSKQHLFFQSKVKELRDGGVEYFGGNEKFLSGASGAGCSASVFFGPIYMDLLAGRVKRVLLVATGALLSPLSFQQGMTIPTTAHAVEVVMEGGTSG